MSFLARLSRSRETWRTRAREAAEQPRRAGDEDRSLREARAASSGALGCIVVAQLLFAAVLLQPASAPVPADDECMGSCRQGTAPWTVLLAASWLFFNGVHFAMWRSNPGYVTRASPRVDSPPAADGASDGEIDGDTGMRWCVFCAVWQPVRTKHCDKCAKCVRKFDHHCFWVGACVGERNHPRFVALLCVDTIFLSAACHALWHAVGPVAQLSVAVGRAAVTCGLLIFAAAMLVMVCGLLVFHCYLAATAQTTWELICQDRISYIRRAKPFCRGAWHNLREFVAPPAVWDIAPDRAPLALI